MPSSVVVNVYVSLSMNAAYDGNIDTHPFVAADQQLDRPEDEAYRANI